MPLYVYQIIKPDGDGETFEWLQEMDEPPLTRHPETGEPVQRLLGAPNTPRKYGDANLSNQNLERLGFTKYERNRQGKYEKSVGRGPNVIQGE